MFAFENVNKMFLIVLYVIELWSIATSREEAGRRKKNNLQMYRKIVQLIK